MGQSVAISCPEAVNNHCKCRRTVDNRDNNRHQPTSFEETWATQWWPGRAFAFLLAATEVNAKVVNENLLGRAKVGLLAFRKQLARVLTRSGCFELETSGEQQRESPRQKGRTMQHEKVVMPVCQKLRRSELAPSETKRNQAKRAGCKKRVRTCCKCSPGMTNKM
jgi:hypothetical protein